MGQALLFGAAMKMGLWGSGFVFAFLFLIGVTARADFESYLDSTVRSYPLSGTLNVSAGYAHKIWGEGSGGHPFYGFIKPEAQFATAATYNSALVQLKIFPVSFFGFMGGVEGVSNLVDYMAYDCKRYRCTGRSWQSFGEIWLGAAAGSLFGFVKGGLAEWKQDADQTRDLINPTWGIATAQSGDQLRYLKSALGVKVSDDWKALYSFSWVAARELKLQSQMHLGLVQWSKGAWSVGGGVGHFQSGIKGEALTFVINAKWAWSGPSMEQF